MQISASLFAVNSNWFDYANVLKSSMVDYLHIDLFQNNQTHFHLKDILKFDLSYLPLDVHLIYEQLGAEEIEILNHSTAKYLNIQYETLIDKNSVVDISKKFKGKTGLAITIETPMEVVEHYIPQVSQLLIMCSEPGVSGAKFDERNIERIQQLRDHYPSLPLFADGGIDDTKAELMNGLGVKMLISGSFIAKNLSDLGKNIYLLKYANEKNIPIQRNMIPKSQLPVVSSNSNFIDVIYAMNSYRLGIVFVEEHEHLQGVITDGDVRRAYLKYEKELFDQTAEQIMNQNPITASGSFTMESVFQQIISKYKGVYVLPIIEDGSLIGAVDLHIN